MKSCLTDLIPLRLTTSLLFPDTQKCCRMKRMYVFSSHLKSDLTFRFFLLPWTPSRKRDWRLP